MAEKERKEEQQQEPPAPDTPPQAGSGTDAGEVALPPLDAPVEQTLAADYSQVLGEFIRIQSEKALYDASELSKLFVERGVGPEEIVALHSEMIEELIRGLPLIEKPRAMTVSLQFLLEVMITYGISYKEYLDLKLVEATRSIERQLEIDRIRAKEEIRRQHDVLRAKEEFLEFFTHELRNPLATLMASIEYMLGGLGREDTERRERILVRMRESINQLIRMVNELLAVSRAEAGERILKLEPLVLDALLHNVVNRAAALAGERNIELSAQLAGAETRIMGDQEWLEQALGNIVNGAMRLAPDGGKVWVRTAATRTQVTVEIANTGPGIPPEEIPRVFDKYHQISQSNGVGIGLYSAKRVVERHGGEISVESQPGQGARFLVSFPQA